MHVVNTTKQSLLAGNPVFGYALELGSPFAAELLSRSGIGFLMLDTQHGSFGPDSTVAAFAAMSGGDATPLARVARNDYTLIGRLLDVGALGIIVPMVDTPEQAHAAADACRFPPAGIRSWGWGRAAAYGDDYPDWINDEMLVMVQIESATAVKNAEAILATPGVDGCWIGPNDLALSMGIHPRERERDERVIAAVDSVLQACQSTGKIPGYAGSSPTQARQLATRGFRFLTCGSDAGFLHSGAAAGLQELAGS